MVNIKIEPNKFWKCHKSTKSNLWIKGYLYSHTIEELLLELDNSEANNLESLISSLNGHFAIVFQNKNFTLAIVDRVRSIPIQFTEISGDFFISDRSNTLKNLAGFDSKRNKEALLEIEMSGFVIGSNCVYESIKSLAAGQFVLFKNNKSFKVNNYYSYFGEISKSNYDLLLKELEVTTISIFKKLLKNIGDREILVPLSAGFDSRLVVSILKHLGANNVKCYSYGQRNNFEAITAKKIADKLGYKWTFVELSHKTEKRFYNSNFFKKYTQEYDSGTAVAYFQSLSTISYLKRINFIDDNTVIINGNSGDFISGAHINSLFEKLKNINITSDAELMSIITEKLLDKHFSLWGLLKTDKNLSVIKNNIIESLRNRCFGLNKSNAHLFYEYSELIDRQSKYVISGQRVFEFHGNEWRMPLWDDEYLSFWQKIPSQLKSNQKLYKEMLLKNNFGGVWDESIPINKKNIRPLWIIPLRFLFMIPFIIFGKNEWKNFDKIFFYYWRDPTLMICYSSYFKIIKDYFKYPRNHVSWISKDYSDSLK